MANVRSRVEYLITARDKATAVFTKTTSRVSRALSGVGRAAGAIGLAATAAATAAVALSKSLTKAADDLAKFVRRGVALGFTADQFIGITQAVEDSGGSIKKAEVAFQRFTRSMSDADNGLLSVKRAFDNMGVSLKDGEGNMRAQGEVLSEIIDKLAESGNATEHASSLNYIFGRNWLQLVRISELGVGAMDRYTESVEALGLSVDQDLLAKSEEAQDKMTLLGKIVKNQVAHNFSEFLAPAISEVSEALIVFTAEVSKADTTTGDFVEALIGLTSIGRGTLVVINDWIAGFRKLALATETSILLMENLFDKNAREFILKRHKEVSKDILDQQKKRNEEIKAGEEEYRALLRGDDIRENMDDRLVGQGMTKEEKEDQRIIESHQRAAKEQTRILREQEEEEERIHKQHGRVMLGVAKKQASALAAHSKKAAKVQQAIRIGEAINEGWSAAVSSYEWGAKVGGPPLGAAMAALSLAATGAYIKQLGGSQEAGGTVSGAPLGSAAEPITTQPAFGVGGGEQGRVVNINITGEKFGHAQVVELVESINEELGDESFVLNLGTSR